MFDVNEYFDGNVKSIAFQGEQLPSTVGVMAVSAGALIIKLPGSDEWKTFSAGESFNVEANVSFGVQVKTDTAYLCTYE